MKKPVMMTVDVNGEYDDVDWSISPKGTLGCLGVIVGCLAIDALVVWGIVELVGYVGSRV